MARQAMRPEDRPAADKNAYAALQSEHVVKSAGTLPSPYIRGPHGQLPSETFPPESPAKSRRASDPPTGSSTKGRHSGGDSRRNRGGRTTRESKEHSERNACDSDGTESDGRLSDPDDGRYRVEVKRMKDYGLVGTPDPASRAPTESTALFSIRNYWDLVDAKYQSNRPYLENSEALHKYTASSWYDTCTVCLRVWC